MIRIEHVRKSFGDFTPIKDANAVINDGDVISIIGPSGTGKSTLLRALNLIDPPTSGKIYLDNEEITAKGCDISAVRRKMGMVFQSFNLFGHLTVIENIMLAQTELLRKSRQEAFDKGIELLRRVGLAKKYLNYPDELSGGQKQRVAIARTLATDPEVILFDEPTSALDPTMVGEVESVIQELSRSGKTLLIVTHEMRFAKLVSNRVFYMDQGLIYDDGTPEQIFEHPEKERTRKFIKQLKTLELCVESRDFDFLGEGAEIDKYLAKNRLDPKTAYRIRSSVEELVQQILLPELEKPMIRILIEYSEKEGTTKVIVRYNGKPFGPEESKNRLSYKLLENAVSEMRYERIKEDPYINKVTMLIS